MAGYPVSRATTGDGGWVYTLYRQDDNYPFIHALDTVHHSAVCIGLPAKWTINGGWISAAAAEAHQRWARGRDEGRQDPFRAEHGDVPGDEALVALATAEVQRAALRRWPPARRQGRPAPRVAAGRRAPLSAPGRGRSLRRRLSRSARRYARSASAISSASAAACAGPWPGTTCPGGSCRSSSMSARQGRAVLRRRRRERELRVRQVIADREQIELADAVAGAVGGVAAERDRLDGERADPMRDADSPAPGRRAARRRSSARTRQRPRGSGRAARRSRLSPRSRRPSSRSLRGTLRCRRRDPSRRAWRARASRVRPARRHDRRSEPPPRPRCTGR